MQSKLTTIKQLVKGTHTVIVIDNSNITKPTNRKFEALSQTCDSSIGKVAQRYLTVELAVLSRIWKTSPPIYEKLFYATEKSFINEIHKSLRYLKSLSDNFTLKYACTLDSGSNANNFLPTLPVAQ